MICQVIQLSGKQQSKCLKKACHEKSWKRWLVKKEDGERKGHFLGEGYTKVSYCDKMLTYERTCQHFETLTLTVNDSTSIIIILLQYQVRMLMSVWVKRSSDRVLPPILSIHEPCRRSGIIDLYFTNILRIFYEYCQISYQLHLESYILRTRRRYWD